MKSAISIFQEFQDSLIILNTVGISQVVFKNCENHGKIEFLSSTSLQYRLNYKCRDRYTIYVYVLDLGKDGIN